MNNKIFLCSKDKNKPIITQYRKSFFDTIKKTLAKILLCDVKEKSLEFEKDTFRIDSAWWVEPIEGVFAWKKVLVNPTWDVVEYLEDYIRDGVIIPTKGKQMFMNYDSFIKYVAQDKKCSVQKAEKKYILNEEEYKKKMRQIDRDWTYPDIYKEYIKDHLMGYWYPDGDKFDDVGRWANFWIAGGGHAALSKYGWDYIPHNRYFGFSGRLLKN